MKINWKVRFRNPYFYLALLLAIVAPIGLAFGLNFEDLTSWSMVWDIAKRALLTPHLVITVIIAVVTFLIDPTTKGIGDSSQALRYEKPRER